MACGEDVDALLNSFLDLSNLLAIKTILELPILQGRHVHDAGLRLWTQVAGYEEARELRECPWQLLVPVHFLGLLPSKHGMFLEN